jgi:PAS domain S-box-containing protein
VAVDAVGEYAIFRLDSSGVVQTWNRGARRIKGYAAEEVLGRHISAFYSPDERRAGLPESHLARAARHGQWWGQGWRIRKDGTRFWANVVITAVFDRDGRLDGFVKVTRDESERRATQDAQADLALLLERARIGRSLSDTTVRSVFSAALVLDSALTVSHDPLVTAHIVQAIAILEDTLTQIRDTVTGHVPDRGTGCTDALRPAGT